MLKKKSIKSQIVVWVALILSLIVLFQIFLYSLLQKESNNIVSSIFDSITQDSVQQINKLNHDIAESAFSLSIHRTIQENLYEYSPVEIIQNLHVLDSLLINYLSSNQNIAYLGIVKNNSLFRSSERVPLYGKVFEILQTLEMPDGTDTFFLPSFVHEGKIFFTCVSPIFPSKLMRFSDNNNEENFIVCVYEVGSIGYINSGVIDNGLINLVITDKENRIMLSSDPSEHNTKFIFDENDNKFLSSSVSLEDPQWNVTTFIPKKSSSIFSNLTLFFIIFMIVFTIGMLFLLLKLLNNIIVKRILSLTNQVSKISENDETYRINYPHNDELLNVAKTMNHVLGKVHDANEERLNTANSLYQAQLLQKETRVFYLYSQVSPHFLYNSLAHIQGLAAEARAPKIITMVSSLSRVFRYFSNNQRLSTIKDDLDCAIEYFNIINTQRTNKIQLTNNVGAELFDVKCLKMLYQPILENTLKHAFGIDNTGNVTISSVPHDTKAIIEISDDGRGIGEAALENIRVSLAEKDLNEVQNSDHIGLLNVNMRLRLCYNDSCGIEIFSKENEGTTVRITFEKEAPDA